MRPAGTASGRLPTGSPKARLAFRPSGCSPRCVTALNCLVSKGSRLTNNVSALLELGWFVSYADRGFSVSAPSASQAVLDTGAPFGLANHAGNIWSPNQCEPREKRPTCRVQQRARLKPMAGRPSAPGSGKWLLFQRSPPDLRRVSFSNPSLEGTQSGCKG